MATGDSLLAEERSLSKALLIMIGPGGLRLPGLDTVGGLEQHGPIPLALPEIFLLSVLRRGSRRLSEAVAEVAERTGAEPERLSDLLEKLADRGLLADATSDAGTLGTGASPAGPEGSSSLEPSAMLSIDSPQLLRLTPEGFEDIDHDGRLRIRLSSVELVAASEFREPITVQRAFEAHVQSCGPLALDEEAFGDLAGRLARTRLLEQSELLESDLGRIMRRGRPSFGRERAEERDFQRFQTLNGSIRKVVREFEAAEHEREQRTGKKRIRVVSVQRNGTIFPLALGMIIATAKEYEGGRLEEHFAFHPDWLIRPSKVRSLVREPGIFLFSNYNWSHHHNRKVSKKVKELSPWSLTIHGGPNTPKYPVDCEAYFRANPDVDVTVRAEGEATFCEILSVLAETDAIGHGPPDLTKLRDIAGISFRDGDRIVTNPDRPRITDLDSIPSPILTGLADAYSGETTMLGIIETNRGCPFTCAFCDWGSAIASKIRRFSLDRVFAELEWFARNQVAGIMCADANFGVFERDVEIARKVAELKEEYGFPKAFSASFAKNTTRHTKRIIQILSDHGVISKGNIAVQSLDQTTLATIKRSNIKLEKYEELSQEFRNAGLPLWVDLMFGLPGQTSASFQNDLQGCIDRGVFPRMFMTELLINSPMNEPSYREEHQIETTLSPDGSRRLIVATSSFSRQEFKEMNGLRLLFVLCDTIGMLRHVAHFVRSETGMREIDFYERLRRDVHADPESWPVLAFSVRALLGLLVPPVSWHLAIEEIESYLTEVLGLENNTAMQTILAVQKAVLPARNRPMPETLDLPHDYVAWHKSMVKATQAGHKADWHSVIPKLSELGPGSLTIDDPDHICDFGIGSAVDGDLYGNFELLSPIARWTRPEGRPRLDDLAMVG